MSLQELQEGVSVAVSPGVAVALPPTPSLTCDDDPALRLTVVPAFSASPHLSPRDLAIITTVTRFRQITAGQLQRLFFSDKSPVSRATRCRRTLARLHRWGYLSRIERAQGGYRGGSEGYMYLPQGSRARMPNPHTTDITELWVRLVEAHRRGEISLVEHGLDPEPYCHVYLGNFQYKPDGRVHLKSPSGEFMWFLELDRGTEWRTKVGEKMRRAVQAYKRWPERTFPRVLWIVPDSQRADFVRGVAKGQEINLFEVCLFDEATTILGE